MPKDTKPLNLLYTAVSLTQLVEAATQSGPGLQEQECSASGFTERCFTYSEAAVADCGRHELTRTNERQVRG